MSAQHVCADAGGRKVDGSPCMQSTGAGRRCIWHPDGVSEAEASRHRTAVATVGSLAAHIPQILPPNTPPLLLADAKGCIRALELTVQQIRLGQLSPDRGNAVIQGIKVAVSVGHLMLAARIARLEEQVS